MSKHKWDCIVRKCRDGQWLVADATATHWLMGNGLWVKCSAGYEFWDAGTCDGKAMAIDRLDRATTPPPTYSAPHIEVKPLADEADRHFAQAVEAFNELKKLYDRVVAERDAARAELKKEEGK